MSSNTIPVQNEEKSDQPAATGGSRERWVKHGRCPCHHNGDLRNWLAGLLAEYCIAAFVSSATWLPLADGRRVA